MDHDVSAGLDHAEAETAARSDVRQRASGVAGDQHPTVGVEPVILPNA